MKLFRLLSIVMLVFMSQSSVAGTSVASVPSVDLSRYSGKWFEIASFPMFFQQNCIADTTAEYSSASDGTILVHNRCRTKCGFDEANGKASPVYSFANSRLKVWFFWPFKADNWNVGLDQQRYAHERSDFGRHFKELTATLANLGGTAS